MGMYNQKSRGRKYKSNQWQKQKVKEWVKSEQKTLNKVMYKVLKKMGNRGWERENKSKDSGPMEKPINLGG